MSSSCTRSRDRERDCALLRCVVFFEEVPVTSLHIFAMPDFFFFGFSSTFSSTPRCGVKTVLCLHPRSEGALLPISICEGCCRALSRWSATLQDEC